MTYFQIGLFAVYTWGFNVSWRNIKRLSDSPQLNDYPIDVYLGRSFLSATWPIILFMSVIEWSQEYQILQHRSEKK
jgi:hypothetical protein